MYRYMYIQKYIYNLSRLALTLLLEDVSTFILPSKISSAKFQAYSYNDDDDNNNDDDDNNNDDDDDDGDGDIRIHIYIFMNHLCRELTELLLHGGVATGLRYPYFIRVRIC
jgi:hypothetical protein